MPLRNAENIFVLYPQWKFSRFITISIGKMPESRPEDALVHLYNLCKLFVQNISHFYIVRYLTELTLLT